jgi:hypothetical protein
MSERCHPRNCARCAAFLIAAMLSVGILPSQSLAGPKIIEVGPNADNTLAKQVTYRSHVDALRLKLEPGFCVIVQHPFVVIGDDEPVIVRRYCQGVVQWATERLKQSYFTEDPDQIYDIWLFKDKDSYDQRRARLFLSQPDTPYGFTAPDEHALVMNISTGRGTLVHEMVHAFIASNFAACPTWFNEGLASLYEKPGDRDGRIYGYTNWRLPALQNGIRAAKLRSFESMLAAGNDSFYRDPYYYAQARYLCYYLQHKGLLQRFYHDFHRNRQDDPTGIDTLRTVLGEPDLKAFQARWQTYVLELTLPPQLNWVDGQGYQE